MGDFAKELDALVGFEQEVAVEKQLILDKALRSNDPASIIKAQTYITELESKNQNLGPKSYVFDPYSYADSLGYKQKPLTLSYDLLRAMARTPIIRSIIETRQDQVSRFSEPTDDEHIEGWTIRKKRKLFEDKDGGKITDQEKKEMRTIMDFIIHGTSVNPEVNNLNLGKLPKERLGISKWNKQPFSVTLKELVRDSLSMDQTTFENVYDRAGRLVEYIPTDAATFRKVETYYNDPTHPENSGKIAINGCFPSYVQVFQGQIENEYYPWELAFGIRNQSTSVLLNGYGISEVEDLMNVITWMLYGDQYNGLFFSQGAQPKGILKLSGNVSRSRLNEFKQQWTTQVTGVHNAHKVPVIESDKMEWLDLHKSNKDMEFEKWQQYLILVSCAVFKITPEEVSFMRGLGNTSMFQPSDKHAYEFSKQKGLVPLLKFFQSMFNKYWVQPISDKYEFVFTGMNPEDEDAAAGIITKKLQYTPLNTLMEELGHKPIEGADDIILNPVFIQWYMQKQMGSPESNEFVDGITGEEGGNYYKEFSDETGQEPTQKSHLTNPMANKLNEWIEKGIN